MIRRLALPAVLLSVLLAGCAQDRTDLQSLSVADRPVSSSTTAPKPTTAAPTTVPVTTLPSTTVPPTTAPTTTRAAAPTTTRPTTRAPSPVAQAPVAAAPRPVRSAQPAPEPPVAAPRPVQQPTPQPEVRPAAAVPPRSSSGCNPNYDPCVPNDPVDVDCEGGSGNGPSYVEGPVRVTGDDVYGLDGNDDDGLGCE